MYNDRVLRVDDKECFGLGPMSNKHNTRPYGLYCQLLLLVMTGDKLIFDSMFAWGFNPFKLSVLFVGHMQTVETQTRRHRTRCLIRVSTVCLWNVL